VTKEKSMKSATPIYPISQILFGFLVTFFITRLNYFLNFNQLGISVTRYSKLRRLLLCLRLPRLPSPTESSLSRSPFPTVSPIIVSAFSDCISDYHCCGVIVSGTTENHIAVSLVRMRIYVALCSIYKN
jgi:hypothetical protein